MKIYFLEPIGQHSGMYEYDSQACRSISKLGFQVTWVTSNSGEKNIDGVETWRVFKDIFSNKNSVFRGVCYVMGWCALFFRLVSESRNNDVVLHGNFLILAPVDVFFYLLCRSFRINVVFSVHDVVPFGSGTLTKKLLRIFYRFIPCLIAHTEFSKKKLIDEFGVSSDKIAIIPHSSYISSVSDQESQTESIAHSLNISSEKDYVILFFGVIRESKGLRYLVEAMPRILDDTKNAVLVIAGKPQDNSIDECVSLISKLDIEKHVRLRIERIPEEDMSHYYQLANVIVTPYLEVYQSGVYYMAAAHALPCIASDVGGFKESIRHRDTGVLVEPANSEAISDAVIELYNNQDLALSIGRKSYDEALTACDWDSIAKDYNVIYDQLVD